VQACPPRAVGAGATVPAVSLWSALRGLFAGRSGARRDRVSYAPRHNGWLPIGQGAWDRQSRQSFVRLDRVIELRADSIRREGSVLDRARFEYVASALRARHDWV
jgi:hypothetical protein